MNFNRKEKSGWPTGHRRCTTCGVLKEFSRFHAHKGCTWGINTVCGECRKPLSKAQWAKKTFEQSLLRNAEYRSFQKGWDCDLTLEDIVIPETCHILRLPIVKQRKHPYGPSIDRIDSAKGYTKDNIQIISKRANLLKLDATKTEIRLLLQWMEKNI